MYPYFVNFVINMKLWKTNYELWEEEYWDNFRKELSRKDYSCDIVKRQEELIPNPNYHELLKVEKNPNTIYGLDYRSSEEV